MALLDTFTILFESDTSKLEKGVDESRKSSDDLVDSLKKADRQASTTGDSFAGYAAKALGALTAALSIGNTISSTIARAGDVHLMNQTAESIGVAVGEMDAFRRSIQDTGGTAQGATSTLEKMAQAIGGALSDVNSSQAKLFASMGIGLKNVDGTSKDAMQGILDLADAVEGMDKAQARFKIRSLGIEDQKSIELILKGRKEIEAMTKAHKEQGVVTKEQAILAGRLDTAMNALRGGMDRASLGIMDLLLPAIIKVTEWLTKVVNWASEHKDFIVGFFGAIAAVVTAIYLPAMIAAAAATIAATWPIIAIGAAVSAVAALFALAYDDIMNFIDGNDSFVGGVFEKYPMVKDLVYGLIDAFKFMGEVVGGVFSMLHEGFKQVLNFITAGISQITSGIGKVAGFFGFGSSDAAAGQKQLAAAAASPLNSTTSSSISNSVASTNRETNVQVGEVIVQTQATDAQGIAGAVGGSLSDQLATLDAETANGIER